MPSSHEDVETPFGIFRNNQDGTFTDVQRKLMWMSAPVGMVWDGSTWRGEPIEMTWRVATRKFGRWVACYSWNRDKLGEILQASAPLSCRRNGFTPGHTKFDFAGHSDWSLPTLDELTTFTFNPIYTSFMYKPTTRTDPELLDNQSRRLILAKLFYPLMSPQDYLSPFWSTWASNPCGWQPRSLISKIDPHWWYTLFKTSATHSHHAWALTLGMDCATDLGGDHSQPARCCATLVRHTEH